MHPVLLEAGEAVGRGTKSDAVAKRLRTGEIKTFEEAAENIVEDSLGDSVFKLIMAFYRRFMLLSMGSVHATMIAVVAASIEEASVCIVAQRNNQDRASPCCVNPPDRSSPHLLHNRPCPGYFWSRLTLKFGNLEAKKSCKATD